MNGGLYFDWPAGLHFELASELSTSHHEMVDSATRLAYQILDAVLDEGDKLCLVIQVFHEHYYHKKGIFKLVSPFLKYKTTTTWIPQMGEDEPGYTRFSLHCTKSQLDLRKLAAVACREDFPDCSPRFSNRRTRYPDVYLVNQTKHLVAFIYDDRGMEVVAKEFETLRPFGERFQELLTYS